MRFHVPKSVPVMGATNSHISLVCPRGQLEQAKGQGSVTSDLYPGQLPSCLHERNAFFKSYQGSSERWGFREGPNPVGDPDKRICACLLSLAGHKGCLFSTSIPALPLPCHHQLCSCPMWHPCIFSQTASQGLRAEHADLVLISSLPLMCHLESELVSLKL